MQRTITVTVNEQAQTHSVPLRLLLVDFLRDACGLASPRVGCGQDARCGACTVHLDGRAIKSCLNYMS